ncbi:hypothetical protein XELAEV_18002566mg [Xenopus laevis]|nr:hypothetical protein XELAEV_18002566mg [Xenopus laevis]
MMEPVTDSVLDLSPNVLVSEGRDKLYNRSDQCKKMSPPESGTLHVVYGNGSSVGSVLMFQCSSMYQLVGEGISTCVWRGNSTLWTSGTPTCHDVWAREVPSVGFGGEHSAAGRRCASVIVPSCGGAVQTVSGGHTIEVYERDKKLMRRFEAHLPE